MRRLACLVGLVILLLAAAARADFQAGVEAYLRGDYETALAEFKPLAEQGACRGAVQPRRHVR